MAVRPFYVSGDIEGRKTLLEGGPRSKDGRMKIEILQRNEGLSETAFTISSQRVGEKLRTDVMDSSGTIIGSHITDY